MGSYQSDLFKRHNHGDKGASFQEYGSSNGFAFGGGGGTYTDGGLYFPYDGGNETRSKNVGVIFCIKN